MENIKTVINHHELTELIAQGVHTNYLDGYTVIISEKIEMDWKDENGKTLGYWLFHDQRWQGLKVIIKHSGMDFITAVAYLRSHWSFWREHLSTLLVQE